MNKLFIAASAAALLSAAGTVPSLAQSSPSGASSMIMPSITCRDLSGMDQQTARNVVFYLGGLNAAQGSSTTTGSSDTSGSSSTTADSGTSGSTTSDTTGSTTAAGGSSGTSDTSSSSSGSASGTVMAQLPGFAMINADQILSTCQSSPDKQLSEVLGSARATTTP